MALVPGHHVDLVTLDLAIERDPRPPLNDAIAELRGQLQGVIGSWWWPAKMVPVRSSNRLWQPPQRNRCRSGWVSSRPSLVTWAEPHSGHRTPSGQRIARTVS